MINVSFSGLLFENEITKQTERAIEETLLYGSILIQEKTPILTGNLSKGWDFDKESIFNEVGYTDYVENGTSRMIGRFMVRDSLPDIEEKLLNNIINELR